MSHQQPCFVCYTCQRHAPLTWLRFRRDPAGRNRRVCQPCHSAGVFPLASSGGNASLASA